VSFLNIFKQNFIFSSLAHCVFETLTNQLQNHEFFLWILIGFNSTFPFLKFNYEFFSKIKKFFEQKGTNFHTFILIFLFIKG
jgi:hypothetical protein